jgi:hypothetical protein
VIGRRAAAVATLVGVAWIAVPAPAAAGHNHCQERSTTLGRRLCTRFGAWSGITRLPPITAEVTVGVRTLPAPPAASPAGAARATESGDASPAMMTAPGAGMRWSVGVGRGLYLGVGTEGGPIGVVASATADGLGPVGFYAMGLVHGGLRRRIGRVQLAAELAVGAAIVPVVESVEPGQDPNTAANARLVLEGRVRADLWLNPWITAGAFAGTAVDGRGTVGGLQLGLHIRALDAGR